MGAIRITSYALRLPLVVPTGRTMCRGPATHLCQQHMCIKTKMQDSRSLSTAELPLASSPRGRGKGKESLVYYQVGSGCC